MNKTISTASGILIVVLVAGIAGASVLFFNQDVEKKVILEEGIFSEKDKIVTKDDSGLEVDKKTEEEASGVGGFANWNTYKNEEIGFEVSHPGDWNAEILPWITEKLKENEWHVIIEPKNRPVGSMEWPSMWFSNYFDPMPGTEISDKEIKFSVDKIPPIGHMVIKLTVNDKIIFSQCSLYNHDLYGFSEEEIISLCNKILSTFRLVN